MINAAREVFGESGLTAPLNSVAKRAGVGQGSLYRHFPDRVSLAVAVFDDNIGELEAIADRPDSTLDDLFDYELPVSFSFGRKKLALKDVLKLAPSSVVELDRGPPGDLANHLQPCAEPHHKFDVIWLALPIFFFSFSN